VPACSVALPEGATLFSNTWLSSAIPVQMPLGLNNLCFVWFLDGPVAAA
jgi:hypothetical protein